MGWRLDSGYTVAHYLATGELDPGESEVLAVARHDGFIVVIDEFVGHCRAESEYIPNTSTLGVLVDAVKNQQIDEAEAAQVWASIQECWDYAPPGPLSDYLHGHPIWPPCRVS